MYILLAICLHYQCIGISYTQLTLTLYLIPSLMNSTSTWFFSELAGRIWPLSREALNVWKQSWIWKSQMWSAPDITPSMTSGFSAWTFSDISLSSQPVVILLFWYSFVSKSLIMYSTVVLKSSKKNNKCFILLLNIYTSFELLFIFSDSNIQIKSIYRHCKIWKYPFVIYLMYKYYVLCIRV